VAAGTNWRFLPRESTAVAQQAGSKWSGDKQQVALVPVVLHFWTSEVLAAVALIASPLASKHVRARLSDAIPQ
jgi:hypothetical protein